MRNYSATALTMLVGLFAALGCADGGERNPFDSAGMTGSPQTSSAGTSEPEPEPASGGSADTSGGGGGPGTPPKLDVSNDSDSPAGPGCAKVDFLFVVDNSGSMSDEQQNLVQSFPGFIAAIQDTVMAKDYHIMAIDTDPAVAVQTCSSTCGSPGCCDGYCVPNPQCACNGVPCTPGPGDCNATLGAGRVSNNGDDCMILGGNRFMTENQPDLVDTFACAALVGTNGSGDEKPMGAMMASVGPLDQPGECNEGFVREDAVLVVTFITDEEDLGSVGNPATWRQTLVDLKAGDDEAIVVLGLVGDNDLPGSICAPANGSFGAEPAPQLRQFAESFPFGMTGSVCEADYAPFFEQAVAVIDTACDEFEPPG